jgi:hypothetical protein
MTAKIVYTVFTLLLLIVSGINSYSQIIDADRSILDQNNLPGFIKEKKPEVDNPYSKNYYLSTYWQVGNVVFVNNKVLDNVLLKYDIVKHIVEIKDGEEVYMVSANSVKDFTWFNNEVSDFEIFESTKNFYDLPEPLFGFMEVLTAHQDGLDEYKVLTHHDVWLYQANTSVSLSGSHRSNDLFWENDFFLFKNGKVTRIAEKRKDNYATFKPFENEMKKFIRNNGLFFKTSEDLTQIYNEYFELMFTN